LKLIIFPWVEASSYVVSQYKTAAGDPFEWWRVRRNWKRYWASENVWCITLSMSPVNCFNELNPWRSATMERNGMVPSSNL
jgi:hypothetical protein